MLTDNRPSLFFSSPPTEAPALSRKTSGDGAAAGACAVLCCAIPLFIGLEAGLGAASGAIGNSIMKSQYNWTAPGFSYENSVQFMALGSAVISLALLCCVSSGDKNKSIAGAIIGTAIAGAIEGMAGAGMLNLLPNGNPHLGEQIGYSAAVGATGNAVIVGGAMGTIIVLACIAICFCGLPKDMNESIKILKLPVTDEKLLLGLTNYIQDSTPDKQAIEDTKAARPTMTV
jgi:hypothetical protein